MPTIEGRWTVSDPKLNFLFVQRGSEVTGEFRDEKTNTFDLTGTLVSNQLSITWKTAFSWLAISESGAGTLVLSADGSTLSGQFTILGTLRSWVLRRVDVPATNELVPSSGTEQAAEDDAGDAFRPREGAFQGYREKMLKDLADAKNDPILRDQLIGRSTVREVAAPAQEPVYKEPELRERVIANKWLKPGEDD
jgi:autotransporter-associated beta strand protein